MQYRDLKYPSLFLFTLILALHPLRTLAQESCSAEATASESSLAVFPGAEGSGTRTVAGSGRHLLSPCTKVMKVTNLNDQGTGSLRACLEAAGPRVCIFEVAGVLRAQDTLRIRSPYVTIAGQTAPAPGFIIRGANISVETSDVLIQHLHLRVGDDPRPSCCGTKSCSSTVICSVDPGSRDGITLYNPSPTPIRNIVVDHVSISWALDEGFSINAGDGGVESVTLSNSIISSGLDMSIHPEASSLKDPGHSKGILIGGRRVSKFSLHHSLLAHNADRNVRVAVHDEVSLEYLNNVIYNWGRGKGVGRTIEGARPSTDTTPRHLIDIVGTTYQPGIDTFCPETTYQPSVCQSLPGGVDTEAARKKMHYILRVGSGVSSGLQPNSRYFLQDNLGPTSTGTNAWDVVDPRFFLSGTSTLIYPSVRAEAPVASSGSVRVEARDSAYSRVLLTAGARPWERDDVDRRVVNDVILGTGTIINCVSADGSERCKKNAGGWPYYRGSVRVLTLPTNLHGDDDRDGYTNLEEWLHSFVK